MGISIVDMGKQFGRGVENYTKGRKRYPDVLFHFYQSIFPPSSKILDMGCGTGLSTRELWEYGYEKIIGADADERMLAEANCLSPYIEYVHAEATSLPFASQTFDCATTFEAFHWFCNEEAIREIKRVLKPKSLFCIARREDPSFYSEFARWLEQWTGMSEKKIDYRPVEKLTGCNFEILEQKSWRIDEVFEWEEALHYCQSVGTWNVLSEEHQKEILPHLGAFITSQMLDGVFVRTVNLTSIVAQSN